MTDSSLDQGLEAFAIPTEAIVLADQRPDAQPRTLVVAALRQELQRRRLALPLGPETDLDNPERLLLLNRVAVQIVTAGLLADQIAIPLPPWQEASQAPQLLAAALVDDDNQVVILPGVLTAQEVISAAASAVTSASEMHLDTSLFQGGLDRLLTYVMVLQPEALPRVGLAPAPPSLAVGISELRDLLAGRIDGIWSNLLGASLQPLGAAAFRGAVTTPPADTFGAGLSLQIPLGLGPDAVLAGDSAASCVERLQLSVAPGSGEAESQSLRVVVASCLQGDLLPDGLALRVSQGDHSHRIVASATSSLHLDLQQRDGLITIAIEFPGLRTLELPSLLWRR